MKTIIFSITAIIGLCISTFPFIFRDDNWDADSASIDCFLILIGSTLFLLFFGLILPFI